MGYELGLTVDHPGPAVNWVRPSRSGGTRGEVRRDGRGLQEGRGRVDHIGTDPRRS